MRFATWISLIMVSPTFLAAAATSHAADDPKKLAIEMTRLIVSKETYQDMIRQMTMGMLASMRQSGAPLPADVESKLQRAIVDLISYDELVNLNAEIYGSRFSVSELKELLKFYKTPLGVKLARLLPEITGEVGQKMGQIIPSRLPAALEKAGLGAPSGGAPPPTK